MKIYKYSVFVLFLFSTSILHAQSDEVTLTVMGQGKTVEEAQQQAFRDAIMQTYGVFVSNNTEVVNEKLKSDSVNTITNGVVKKYVVISTSGSPDGTITSMLKVSVSTSQMGAFFNNTGANATLNGSLLAFAIQQQRLNENNELKAVSSVIKVSEDILSRSFNYNISIPTSPYEVREKDAAKYRVPAIIRISFNENVELFNKLLVDSLEAISLSEAERSAYSSLGKPTYTSYVVMLPPGKFNSRKPAHLRRVTLRSRESAIMLSRLMFYTVPFMASRCVLEDNARIFSTANPSALNVRIDKTSFTDGENNRESLLLAAFGRPEYLESDRDFGYQMDKRRILEWYSIKSRTANIDKIKQVIDDAEVARVARQRRAEPYECFWLFPYMFRSGTLVYNINFYVDYSLEDIGKISSFAVHPRNELLTPEEMTLPDTPGPLRRR
jgi:hypothetical protein